MLPRRTPAPRTAAPVRRQRAPRRPAAGGITQDEADLPGRGNKTLRDLLAFEVRVFLRVLHAAVSYVRVHFGCQVHMPTHYA